MRFAIATTIVVRDLGMINMKMVHHGDYGDLGMINLMMVVVVMMVMIKTKMVEKINTLRAPSS